MAAINIQSLSLQPNVAPQQAPKPVTTQVAQRVFEARPLNELVFHFMPIDALCIMKGVSRVCRDTGRRVEKERVLKAMPDDHFWKEMGGADCLRAVAIRHFGAPIEGPLSRFPALCMAGFEKRGNNFELYVFEKQYSVILRPRLPCLRPRRESITSVVHGLNVKERYLYEMELGAGELYLRELESEKRCLWHTRILATMVFDWCRFKRQTVWHGWLTSFRQSGGQFLDEKKPDLSVNSKDKDV